MTIPLPDHRAEALRTFRSGGGSLATPEAGRCTRSNASLCQGFPLAFFAGCEVPFGRCVLASGSWPGAFLAADGGRRLAGGRMAAIEEWPALLPAAGLPAVVVVWWPGPGVACPKSRPAGCKPAALEQESFPGCPPGPRHARQLCGHQPAGGRRWRC